MTELMRGCESPAEGGGPPCQMPSGCLEHPSPAGHDGVAGPSTDQEMQWASAREESPERAPSLSSQLFLSPPQGLGADCFFRGPSSEPCEEMSRDPVELPCQAMHPGEATPAEGPGCPGLCGEMLPCEDFCLPGLAVQRPFEDPCGEPWPGKARLPSIVVEPSEGGDVESGELRWPPDEFSLLEEEEEEEDDELFTESEEVLATGLSSFESDLEEVLL